MSELLGMLVMALFFISLGLAGMKYRKTWALHLHNNRPTVPYNLALAVATLVAIWNLTGGIGLLLMFSYSVLVDIVMGTLS